MGSSSGGGIFRVLIALVLAGGALFTYFSSTQVNPVTGEKQNITITPEQEIALGLQALPQLQRQYGGTSRDTQGQQRVDRVGERLVRGTAASRSPYRFKFHLLDDPRTVNALALPGGQIFITSALLGRLKSEGELAGVLTHEIGHVVGRHGAEQLAKQQLTQGLTGAAVIATYDPYDPSSRNSAAVAAALGQLVNMRFGREDELESDRLAITYMAEAGYDPRSLLAVMRTLKAAGGGARPPEFFSTHPDPDRRLERIAEAIEQRYPNGVPAGLKPKAPPARCRGRRSRRAGSCRPRAGTDRSPAPRAAPPRTAASGRRRRWSGRPLSRWRRRACCPTGRGGSPII
ncbi:MAG: M48 family metalloprotease [Aphanocapsa lilacina HA4352-LM1]|nr:M48 family metalloprotease [Aphanocapsa lilacina HA4352-LM1]